MLKKIILVVTALLAAVVITFVVLLWPFLSKMSSFNPIPTGAVNHEVFAVKDGYVAVYLVKSADGYLAFDAGMSLTNVGAQIKALGIDPLSVRAVFLTHSDGDHTAALPLFTKATVYLSDREEAVLTGAANRRFLFFSSTNILPVAQHSLMSDGQELRLGGVTVKALATPGHTVGSTSFLVNGKYLFVGDLALIEKGKLVPMPKPPSEDPEKVLASLRKVEALPGVQMIFTAHTGVLKR